MKRSRKIKKQFKTLIDLTTKKGKTLKKIFVELNKKKWTCAKCEALLQIIYNPQLAKKSKGKTKARNGRKSNTRAKRALEIHHKEGISLKAAWRRV